MKNASLLLNVLLLAAVAYLYFLQFGNNKEDQDQSNNPIAEISETSGLQYAYINVDTLDANYEMLKDMYEELGDERSKAERKLEGKMKKFREDAEDFQRRAQSGLITQMEGQTKQEELAKRQEDLLRMQEDLEKKLINLESQRNKELHNSISDYLKQFNKDAGFNLIFGYNGMGNVLYADSSLDITNVILEGLNKTYKENKNQELGE
ncbi:MAG: OmpH family outer membrane protein [Flavobacteriales bacterium]|nr:OmpH family outer membrane protein [Flavobacteriales bacterium]